jgi:hypothetical protein
MLLLPSQSTAATALATDVYCDGVNLPGSISILRFELNASAACSRHALAPLSLSRMQQTRQQLGFRNSCSAHCSTRGGQDATLDILRRDVSNTAFFSSVASCPLHACENICDMEGAQPRQRSVKAAAASLDITPPTLSLDVLFTPSSACECDGSCEFGCVGGAHS